MKKAENKKEESKQVILEAAASQFAVDYAGLIASRVQKSAGADITAQAKQARSLTYGRQPTDAQIGVPCRGEIQSATHRLDGSSAFAAPRIRSAHV